MWALRALSTVNQKIFSVHRTTLFASRIDCICMMWLVFLLYTLLNHVNLKNLPMLQWAISSLPTQTRVYMNQINSRVSSNVTIFDIGEWNATQYLPVSSSVRHHFYVDGSPPRAFLLKEKNYSIFMASIMLVMLLISSSRTIGAWGVVLVDIDNFGMQAFRQLVCPPSVIGRCSFISSAARIKATHSVCEDDVSWITSTNQFLAYLSQRFLLLYL
jgi:hypothetical protein